MINKKLCYSEEHSTSVVLSWCTLSYFSGENLLMANQSLLRNWPRKLPHSAKKRKIMAITPFKVIRDHRFWYQSEAHIFYCTVSKLWLIICHIFASDRGSLHLTTSLAVIPWEYNYR